MAKSAKQVLPEETEQSLVKLGVGVREDGMVEVGLSLTDSRQTATVFDSRGLCVTVLLSPETARTVAAAIVLSANEVARIAADPARLEEIRREAMCARGGFRRLSDAVRTASRRVLN